MHINILLTNGQVLLHIIFTQNTKFSHRSFDLTSYTQGDSGGPLISTAGDGVSPGQNYEHIGVVSWGNGCALAAFPGVYAR